MKTYEDSDEDSCERLARISVTQTGQVSRGASNEVCDSKTRAKLNQNLELGLSHRHRHNIVMEAKEDDSSLQY